MYLQQGVCMNCLTIQYYRSLLSDVANYILSDDELALSIVWIKRHKYSIHSMIRHDEALANMRLC